MAVKRKSEDSSLVAGSGSSSIWTPESELQLFQTLISYKPCGLLKHFQMALIQEKMSIAGFKDITCPDIWKHLHAVYDLEAVEKVERQSAMWQSQFNQPAQEFSLPKKDFGLILNERKKSLGGGGGSATAETNKETAASSSVSTASMSKKSNATAKDKEKETPKSVAEETPKATAGVKRPTRSTPSSTPAKRRKT